MIRILIVDDHPAMRTGLSAVLRAEPGLVPLDAVGSVGDLWPALHRTRPDVVVLDYHLPGDDGVPACRRLKRELPAPAVLLYSAYADAALAIPAVLAGDAAVAGTASHGRPARTTLSLGGMRLARSRRASVLRTCRSPRSRARPVSLVSPMTSAEARIGFAGSPRTHTITGETLRTYAKPAAIGTGMPMLLGTPLAFGAGEGGPLSGGARNPSPNASVAYRAETQIIADTSSYGTRRSNNGGGAIYGCRSLPGGSLANNEPCIRANNLNTGLAFEFDTDGTISAKPGDASKPFITNATGVATGLNADRVDGKHAADIVKDSSAAATAAAKALTPLALVKSDGAPLSARGVETNGVARSAAADHDVKFTGDLSTCALSATVTGTDAGHATVTPTVAADQKTTTVDVRTFNGGGTAADRGFHVVATC